MRSGGKYQITNWTRDSGEKWEVRGGAHPAFSKETYKKPRNASTD